MRIGRILFTSIQKDNSMKPTRNRIFCPQCKRPKMLFESQKKADNFIEFNKSKKTIVMPHAGVIIARFVQGGM